MDTDSQVNSLMLPLQDSVEHKGQDQADIMARDAVQSSTSISRKPESTIEPVLVGEQSQSQGESLLPDVSTDKIATRDEPSRNDQGSNQLFEFFHIRDL